MTSATWDDYMSTTQGMGLPAALLTYLISQNKEDYTESVTRETASHGLSEDEVAQKTRIGRVQDIRNQCGNTLQLTVSLTGGSEGRQPMSEEFKRIQELLTLETAGGVGQAEDEREELLDWDASSKPKERPKTTVSMTLRYAGKGRPLTDPTPWE